MANATKQIVVTKVVLELSEKEALVLRYLTSIIGGNPDTSNRKYIKAIGEALDEAGIEIPHITPYPDQSDGIWFRDGDLLD